MPLPFGEFQGTGVLDFSLCASDPLLQHLSNQNKPKWENLDNKGGGGSYSVGSEPTSVLDTRSPSPPISSSTLSSSLGGGISVGGGGGGGGASTVTTGVATTAVSGDNPSVETGAERCGLGLEDWETVLSGSPSQEQSILKLIMGDIEDPYVGLNKLLQSGTGSQDIGFNAGFGVVDQGFGFEAPMTSANLVTNIDPFVPSDFPPLNNGRIGLVSDPITNPAISSVSAANFLPGMFQGSEGMDEKPQIFNPPLIMNQNKVQFTQNPAMFLPISYAQVQEHNMLSPPPPKRLNSGLIVPNVHHAPKVPFSDSGQELFLRRQQQHQQQQHQLQQRPATMAVAAAAATKQKLVSEELANQQLQQAIVDQLFSTAELIEAGNPLLAQGILARLNQQLSPIGKPFERAAFYFKEALQLLLHVNGTNNSSLTSYSLIFKIGAYKSFCEISPILQFANFTCNQALLEAFEGYDRIHIIDFDIGYGGQWASLMQELVLRNGGAPSLKITAFTSPSMHEELEGRFTQENLKQFANDINMALELEILCLESLNSASWPLSLRSSENEAIAVNLPIGSFSNQPSCLPLVLHFVKQLSPKIVVSLDRGCDRTDVPFPYHMIHALQSYSSLLESLDAVNVNLDALQKIERFLLHPGIERIVLGRHRSPDRTLPWRNLFLQSGFTPLTFSNFTESQAECLVQRTPVRGFHVEKRQSSLVLCWQQKELISVSAWRG
ncbi:GRAS family transcription factor [Tripterygium wilfordii]|uniref:GRAS family transcription factor n=1 Tax=Tripterygium wilfordii TaxID=458696 RepID=A0A7J7CC35_TRIWF|nr:scarecrow-like protein 22 [Tripterygium wilfordii]KAF5731640.1 GRAS family transcription factor [Tripterygium wilfordii]